MFVATGAALQQDEKSDAKFHRGSGWLIYYFRTVGDGWQGGVPRRRNRLRNTRLKARPARIVCM
jgi:hypothetical protein